jgi:glycerol-3-phosphate dehydrogenase
MREEFALTLEDIVFRRTMIGLDADQGRPRYHAIAAIAAAEAGWSPAQEAQQLDGLIEYAESLRVR